MDLLHSGSMGTGDLEGFHTLDSQGSRRIRGNNRKHKEIQTQGQLPVQSSRQPRDGCRYRPAGDPGAAAGTSRRAARGRLPVQAGRLAGGGCRYRPRDGCRYKPVGGSGAAAGTSLHSGQERLGTAAGTSRKLDPGTSWPRQPRFMPVSRGHFCFSSRYQVAQAAPIHTGVQRTPPLRWTMGAGRPRLPVSSGHPPYEGPWGQAGCGYRCPADTPPPMGHGGRQAAAAGAQRTPPLMGHGGRQALAAGDLPYVKKSNGRFAL